MEQQVTMAATSMAEPKRAIEAMLMVSSEPTPAQMLAQLLELPVDTVEGLCRELAMAYDLAGHGFQLVEVAGGWRYQTHPDLHAYVERYASDGMSTRLSTAALETLAIVAYKQPVSRAQVSAIRGVNVDAVLRTLVQRGYVEEVGRDVGVGQAILFGTTQYFLERVGLNATTDLPSLGDFVPSAEVVEALEQTLKVELEPLDTDLAPNEAEAAADTAPGADGGPGVVEEAAVADAPGQNPLASADGDAVADEAAPGVESPAQDSTSAEGDAEIESAAEAIDGPVASPDAPAGDVETDEGAAENGTDLIAEDPVGEVGDHDGELVVADVAEGDDEVVEVITDAFDIEVRVEPAPVADADADSDAEVDADPAVEVMAEEPAAQDQNGSEPVVDNESAVIDLREPTSNGDGPGDTPLNGGNPAVDEIDLRSPSPESPDVADSKDVAVEATAINASAATVADAAPATADARTPIVGPPPIPSSPATVGLSSIDSLLTPEPAPASTQTEGPAIADDDSRQSVEADTDAVEPMADAVPEPTMDPADSAAPPAEPIAETAPTDIAAADSDQSTNGAGPDPDRRGSEASEASPSQTAPPESSSLESSSLESSSMIEREFIVESGRSGRDDGAERTHEALDDDN